MQERVFYLHEDEWAMIEFLPAENSAEFRQTVHSAQAFGEEHFDGFGWTDIYVFPQPMYPFSLRAIPLNELKALLTERFRPADIVQSGYSSYREAQLDGFAFVEAEKADGAFYGYQKNGLVTTLYLHPFNGSSSGIITLFAEILYILGSKYDLVLADRWRSTLVDLKERKEVVEYLKTASD